MNRSKIMIIHTFTKCGAHYYTAIVHSCRLLLMRIVYNPVFGFVHVLILLGQSTNGTGNSKPDQIPKFHNKSLGSFCETGRLGGHFSTKTCLKLVPLLKKERKLRRKCSYVLALLSPRSLLLALTNRMQFH